MPGQTFRQRLPTQQRGRQLRGCCLKTWAGERDNGLEQTLWKSVDLQRSDMASAAPEVPAKKSRAAATTTTTTIAAAAAAADPTPQQLAARFGALREEAVAYRMKALERVANTATTSGIRHFEGLEAAAVAKDSDHTALWLALKSETDPFTAAEGSRVDLSMDLSLISPKSSGTQFVDIGIVGAQLIVDSRVASGQRLVVQGTLRGAAIIAGLVGTLANAQRGLQFSVPVIISSSEPTDEGGISQTRTKVELDFSALLFDNRGFLGLDRLGLRVLSTQDGNLASVQMQLWAQGVDLDISARRPKRPSTSSPRARVPPTSPPRRAASCSASARRRGDSMNDAITVRAALDWVLFHRRRNKQCGAARAAVVAANAAAMRKLGFAAIGAVAFDGARSSISTPTAELLQDWQATAPGSRMRFGAIGSQGAVQAEGDALALDSERLLDSFAGLAAAMKDMQLQMLAHVDCTADGKTVEPASGQALKAAWGAAGAPESACTPLRQLPPRAADHHREIAVVAGAAPGEVAGAHGLWGAFATR